MCRHPIHIRYFDVIIISDASKSPHFHCRLFIKHEQSSQLIRQFRFGVRTVGFASFFCFIVWFRWFVLTYFVPQFPAFVWLCVQAYRIKKKYKIYSHAYTIRYCSLSSDGHIINRTTHELKPKTNVKTIIVAIQCTVHVLIHIFFFSLCSCLPSHL